MSMPSRLHLVRVGASEEFDSRQLVVAAVAILAPVAFAVLLMLAGGPVSWWWLVFAPAGWATVSYAETPVTLLTWASLLVLWVALVPGPFSWWAVPAAMTIAVGHTAVTFLAGRPSAGALPAGTFRRTGRRLRVVGAAVLGVAGLTQAVRAVSLEGQLVLAVAAVLAIAAWVWWGGRREIADGS